MKKHRRLLDKFSYSGITKKLLTLIIIFSIALIPTTTFAATDTDGVHFPLNYSMPAEPYTYSVNVLGPDETSDVPEAGTGNHGFLTTDFSGEIETKGFSPFLPICIFVITTILAFIVLTKIKATKQKTGKFSKSFGLSLQGSPKFLQKVKNPALVLAICFGIGVASPLFVLNSLTSIATTGVEKINFKEHDFDKDIKDGVNPFGIAIKAPTIEKNSASEKDFIISEIKFEAETYNPTGYYIYLDPDCVAIDKIVGEKSTCKESGTDLVGVKKGNKIPSIKKEMTAEELYNQSSAAWGWSTDGKTFYPASEYLSLKDGGSIYYAVKISSKTPSDTYSIKQNVIALTSDIDDQFAKYHLSYSTGETDAKVFYKKDPGYFVLKTPKEIEGYTFKGWKTNWKSDKTYKPGDHLTPNTTITTLYADLEKDGYDYEYKVNFDQSYYFQEIFVSENDDEKGANAPECDEGDYLCGDGETEEETAADNKRRAGKTAYENEAKDKHFEKYIEKAPELSNEDSYTIDLNEKDGKGDFVYVPKLKGYTFLGWTDFDPETSCKISRLESHDDSNNIPDKDDAEKTELEAALACLSSQENGIFYHFFNNKFEILKTSEESTNEANTADETNAQNEKTEQPEGAEETEGAKDDVVITLTPEKEEITLHAVYMLNPIKYRVEFYDTCEDTSGQFISSTNNPDLFTKYKNGRIATAEYGQEHSGQWVSCLDESIYDTGSEDIYTTWEDMLKADDENSIVSIEKLARNTRGVHTTETTSASSPKSLNNSLSVLSLTTLLDEHYKNEDEEETEEKDEEEDKKEEKEEKTEEKTETQPKKAEKRTVDPVSSATETEKTEEKENLKEQTDDNGNTLLYYDDSTTSTPYYVKPLGVKEEELYEKSGNSVVTTICVIVLVVSGLGIASIILFPVFAKSHSKKQKPSRF